MSTTYHAAAVVGCKINKSKIFFTEKVRGCGHYSALAEDKFCPHCGQKAWREERRSILEYDKDEGTICGFRVFNNEHENYVFVAGRCTETDQFAYQPAKMLGTSTIHTEVQMKLKSALAPLGLWDYEQFGIWVIVWTS